MKTQLKTVAFILAFAFICTGVQSALAFDAKYKYTIPTMKTQEDIAKVTAFIKGLPGIMEITVLEENNQVIVFFDDEELDDEKFQLRIPMKKELGYPVTAFDILYEDPNKRN
ncbi:MAG TPA: copper chaperone [Desulfobacterales bacterium]|nr:copper chaperone [Desulfobacterales bacterium]HIP39862.1 copper chaperone [Desulfocapsa sulfexigens]